MLMSELYAWLEATLNIGKPRRTIYIEPIEEPTSAPTEPMPSERPSEPSDPAPTEPAPVP